MAVTRIQLLRRGALAAGGAGLGLLEAPVALAHGDGHHHDQGDPAPRPIPGGFDETFTPVPANPFIHVLPPAIGFEMSTITDFNGVIAAGEIQGLAKGTDGSTLGFDCDMRFMEGVYRGMDGRIREGSFGFI
jgi:hypothetical protein